MHHADRQEQHGHADCLAWRVHRAGELERLRFDLWTCTVTTGTDRTVTAKLTRVACTLTVQANGTGSGLVTGNGIDCGGTCSASVPYGTVVSLAATPGACSSFNGWDGCDSIAGDSCAATMDDDRTVDPTFTRFPVICSAGETRCVAGDIGAVRACDVCGATWVQGSCDGASSLCSDPACRPVCGINSEPTYPTLCVSPNADGVNDGIWLTWSDSRLGSPTSRSWGGVAGRGRPAALAQT